MKLYIIIFFTSYASWCFPAVQDATHIVELFKTFDTAYQQHNKEFDPYEQNTPKEINKLNSGIGSLNDHYLKNLKQGLGKLSLSSFLKPAPDQKISFRVMDAYVTYFLGLMANLLRRYYFYLTHLPAGADSAVVKNMSKVMYETLIYFQQIRTTFEAVASNDIAQPAYVLSSNIAENIGKLKNLIGGQGKSPPLIISGRERRPGGLPLPPIPPKKEKPLDAPISFEKVEEQLKKQKSFSIANVPPIKPQPSAPQKFSILEKVINSQLETLKKDVYDLNRQVKEGKFLQAGVTAKKINNVLKLIIDDHFTFIREMKEASINNAPAMAALEQYEHTIRLIFDALYVHDESWYREFIKSIPENELQELGVKKTSYPREVAQKPELPELPENERPPWYGRSRNTVNPEDQTWYEKISNFNRTRNGLSISQASTSDEVKKAIEQAEYLSSYETLDTKTKQLGLPLLEGGNQMAQTAANPLIRAQAQATIKQYKEVQQRVKEAKDTLLDAEKRKKYDELLEKWKQRGLL